MKTFKLFISIIGLAFLVIMPLFVFEMRKGMFLRNELIEKRATVKDAVQAATKLEKLQKDMDDLQRENERIDERIPQNEKEPLTLIKQLTLLSNSQRVKNLKVAYSETKKISSSTSTPQVVYQDGQDSSSLPQATQPTTSVQDVSFKIKKQYIQMDFECQFPQLLGLLREIYKLPRLVSVDSVQIKRDEKILPRQKVTVNLISYTFISQRAIATDRTQRIQN